MRILKCCTLCGSHNSLAFCADLVMELHKHGAPPEQDLQAGSYPVSCCSATISPNEKSDKATRSSKNLLGCSHCSKNFKYKSNLVRHVRTHTNERPYRCDHCSRAFADKCNLVSHIRTHTGERPYCCNTCGRSFRLKKTLLNHLRTHTGQRPFTCELCPMAFAQNVTLKKHVQRHRRKKWWDSLQPQGVHVQITCQEKTESCSNLEPLCKTLLISVPSIFNSCKI